MSERHNGWTNRETWCLSLWLANDVDLYTAARELAVAATDKEVAAASLKTWVEKELWPAFEQRPEGRLIIRDVGSLWRIDWKQVADSFREE